MKNLIAFICGFIIFMSLTIIANANECKYLNDHGKEVTIQYKTFTSFGDASMFAWENGIDEKNIIWSAEGYFYVFNYLPNKIFTCVFMK